MQASGLVSLTTFRMSHIEFKEIRKEWKQRKKEEENQRKADEERARAQNGGSTDNPPSDPNQTQGANYPSGARPQLPPIGYAPAGGQVPQQYGSGVDQIYQAGSNGQVYPGYPHSPYGQGPEIQPPRPLVAYHPNPPPRGGGWTSYIPTDTASEIDKWHQLCSAIGSLALRKMMLFLGSPRTTLETSCADTIRYDYDRWEWRNWVQRKRGGRSSPCSLARSPTKRIWGGRRVFCGGGLHKHTTYDSPFPFFFFSPPTPLLHAIISTTADHIGTFFRIGGTSI